MKHWRCRECGEVTIHRQFHAKNKHKNWNFKVFKIEWQRLDSKFEQVENILGSWTIVYPPNRMGKMASN